MTEQQAKYDPVNNPKHYDLFPGEQSIDLIEKCLTHDEFIGFLKGNALKYRFRAGSKDKLQQDIDKANWYQNKLRSFMAKLNKIGVSVLAPTKQKTGST